MGVDSCDNFFAVYLIFKLLNRGRSIIEWLCTHHLARNQIVANFIDTMLISAKLITFLHFRSVEVWKNGLIT